MPPRALLRSPLAAAALLALAATAPLHAQLAPAAGEPSAAPAADWSRADSIALHAPQAAEASVPALAAYLTAGLETEAEKARAIYRWVTENVGYATGGSQSPDAVLRRRTGTCDGYAFLFQALGRQAGLVVEYVDGEAKGEGVRSGEAGGGHGWNAVKIDGQWRLVDATWGASDPWGGGRYQQHFHDFYFLTPPEKLIWSHRPMAGGWQLLPEPVSGGTFRRRPLVSRTLWELGIPAEEVARAAATPGFGEFVRTSERSGERPVRVERAPLERRLRRGQAYEFALRAPGAAEVKVATPTTPWPRLARDGDLFTGTVTAAGGALQVMVVYPDDPTGEVVLLYDVS